MLAVQCLTYAAADPALPYATRQGLYEAATVRGEPAIARLFLAASPAPQHARSARRSSRRSGRKLAAHPRWSARHAVKRALVRNPSTPLADAIRIATTLGVAELRELANDPALPEPLRTHAAEIRAAARRPQA